MDAGITGLKMKQAPLVNVKKEFKQKSRSGKSGWQAWKEKRQIREALELSRKETEVALLRAKVEGASPKRAEQLQIVQSDPSSSSSYLAAPVPPFPIEPAVEDIPQEKGVQTLLSLLDLKDEDTQTPDWRRPYVLGSPVLQAYPHYINGVEPDDVPSPNPLASKTRHRAASLSPSASRTRRGALQRRVCRFPSLEDCEIVSLQTVGPKLRLSKWGHAGEMASGRLADAASTRCAHL